MRISSSLALTAFGCVAQGLALKRGTNTHSQGRSDYGVRDVCGDSTFKDETSSDTAAPLGDCRALLDKFRGFETTITFFIGYNKDHLKSEYMDLMSVGDCGFGAKPLDAADGDAVITFGDAGDILNDSITMFSKNDRVGSSGEMYCQSNKDVGGWKYQPYHKGGYEKRKFAWKIYKKGSIPEEPDY